MGKKETEAQIIASFPPREGPVYYTSEKWTKSMQSYGPVVLENLGHKRIRTVAWGKKRFAEFFCLPFSAGREKNRPIYCLSPFRTNARFLQMSEVMRVVTTFEGLHKRKKADKAYGVNDIISVSVGQLQNCVSGGGGMDPENVLLMGTD